MPLAISSWQYDRCFDLISHAYTYSILRLLLQSFDFASLALRTVTFGVVGKSALTGQPLV